MSRPTVTVLIALYRAGQYLRAKLDNLSQQTIFNECEFILLNCQNLDNEQSKYQLFLRNSNVREILYKDYVYLYPTWNHGIKSTDSEFICNSNVDDMWHPTYLEECAKFLRENEDYAVVSTKVLTTDKANQSNHKTWYTIGAMPPEIYPLSSAGPCPVWRRSLHDKYGYFGDYAVIGDARMWEKWLAGNEKFGLIHKSLALYFINPVSLERRNCPKGNGPLRAIDLRK